ncbi:MAG TPA: asparagine synthase-related protein [Longimicrobium sp.]
MSGFVAIVHRDGAPVDPGVLARLTEAMAFRGPDARETALVGRVGLGHALLRVERESQAERQPLELGGRWLVGDVRLDARGELVDALRAAGLPAREEAPDAELALLAYAAWGERAPERLLGDYSFAVWDAPRRRLFAARDALGVRPLFYAEAGPALVVSNTLDAVRAHPAVPAELNEQAVGDFLLLGMNHEVDTTFFAAVRRLPGGHALTWEEGGAPVVRRWWSLPLDGRVRYRRAEEYAEHYRALLDRAVADRLRTDRAGIFLSGGLDSTSVAASAHAALSARGAPFDLRAHTSVSEALIPGDREGELAGMVAGRLGIPHRPHVVDGYRPYDGWDLPRMHAPEPYDNPLGIVFSSQVAEVAGYARLVLGGEGGDLLFYPSHGHFRRVLARGRALRFARDAWAYLRRVHAPPPVGARTAWRRLRGRGEWAPAVPEWVRPDFARRVGLHERWARFRAAETARALHPERPEGHERLLSPYWPYVFSVYDPGTTRLPVRAALPLFDLRLVDFVFAVPPVPWLPDKTLAREAMRGRLPEAVRRRPKSPVSVWPLLAHLQRYGADWSGVLEAAPEVERFVDPARVPVRAEPGRPLEDYAFVANTRAVSLARWLRQIHTPTREA